MSGYRFGKHPPKHDYRTLRFKDYLSRELAARLSLSGELPRVCQRQARFSSSPYTSSCDCELARLPTRTGVAPR